MHLTTESAPNVFSSGSTISSSQMNENFNFLASEIREKDVDCDNGETISDAINEGYNSFKFKHVMVEFNAYICIC